MNCPNCERLEAELAQAKEDITRAERSVELALGNVVRANDRAEAAESEVTKLKEQNRWIPVEEKLPEPYTSVFIAHNDTYDGTTAVEEAGWFADEQEFNLIRTNPCDETIRLALKDGRVTHWRPLPEPPAREGDNGPK